MKSKALILFAVVLFALAPAPARAAEEGMTLDDVLAHHYEAIGGLDNWKSLKSFRLTGTMSMGGGMEIPFTMVQKRPDKFRMEFTFQGMTGIQAYDGKTAWQVMPFQGKTDAEEMSDDQRDQFKEQADIDGLLIGWKESGHKVELIGLEETEGTESYKIKVTKANGDVRYIYLDSEHFIPIKQEGKTKIQDNEIEGESSMGDYKEVGGLMFAHSIENRQKGAPQGQVITVKEIELNTDEPDDEFTMPAKPAKEEKAEEEGAGSQ